MTTLIVYPVTAPLQGSVPLPSDKSIGHRALLLASICNGTSSISGFSRGEDNLATANAFRQLGVTIEETGGADLRVHGRGLFGLEAPKGAIDCGNSGTTMRLLAGLLSAQPFESTLVGDVSLSKRPMNRIAVPLRKRGAAIRGAVHPLRADEVTAPLVVGPLADGAYLTEIEHDLAVASAQVKSALLLSGLYAHGVTCIREPHISRDHTERMLRALGVPLDTMGSMVVLDPAGWNGSMEGFEATLPGDLSAAAFVLVAGQIVPGSNVTARAVGANPTRTGILEIARDMGAGLHVESLGDRAGEPIADMHAWSLPLRGGLLAGEVVSRAIDEIPIACALAARAQGTTTICDARELRVKESDRIAAMIEVLRAFGVGCEERPDGMVIEGAEGPLKPVDVSSRGDHRIAMTASVLALVAGGPSRIRDAECIATSFPKFVATLRALGATINVEP